MTTAKASTTVAPLALSEQTAALVKSANDANRSADSTKWAALVGECVGGSKIRTGGLVSEQYRLGMGDKRTRGATLKSAFPAWRDDDRSRAARVISLILDGTFRVTANASKGAGTVSSWTEACAKFPKKTRVVATPAAPAAPAEGSEAAEAVTIAPALDVATFAAICDTFARAGLFKTLKESEACAVKAVRDAIARYAAELASK